MSSSNSLEKKSFGYIDQENQGWTNDKSWYFVWIGSHVNGCTSNDL